MKRTVTIEVCPFPMCGFVRGKQVAPESTTCPHHKTVPRDLEIHTVIIDPANKQRRQRSADDMNREDGLR